MNQMFVDANHSQEEFWFKCEKCEALSRSALFYWQAWERAKRDGWHALPVEDMYGNIIQWTHYCPDHAGAYRKAREREMDKRTDFSIALHNQRAQLTGEKP